MNEREDPTIEDFRVAMHLIEAAARLSITSPQIYGSHEQILRGIAEVSADILRKPPQQRLPQP